VPPPNNSTAIQEWLVLEGPNDLRRNFSFLPYLSNWYKKKAAFWLGSFLLVFC
jgi:hypothetical protein